MSDRRQFLKAGAALAAVGPALARAEVPPHLWQGHDFGPGPAVPDRLDQGPFGIEQDEGWYTIATTTPDPGRVALTARSDRFTRAKWAGLLGPLDLAALRPRDFEMVEAGDRIPLTNDCVRNP